jgi:type II secretory pathway predicted ATPase ExeA
MVTAPNMQPIIKTSSIKRFRNLTILLQDDTKQYSTMAAVTGTAGIGKTVAVSSIMASFNTAQAHTGLPPIAMITLQPRPTPRSIAAEIARTMQQREPGRKTTYEISRDVATLIERNDIKLLIVDESDRLDEHGFDLLRSIFDTTNCPILLTGLPSLLKVISRYEKFESRVGIKMMFEPLKQDEVLNEFLPGLVFPGWRYDPESVADREVGIFIWERVGPSLRKLRNILQLASQTCVACKAEKITLEHVKEAMKWAPSNKASKNDNLGGLTDEMSKYEILSELRYRARKKSK